MLKKKILLLVISALLLFVGCGVYITAVGHTYTYNILSGADIQTEDVSVKLDRNDTVKVSSIKGGTIVFESIGKGDANAEISYTEVYNNNNSEKMNYYIRLHTTSLGTIINIDIFDFNGYISIINAAFLYLALLLGVIIHSARQSYKKNLYSYKNMVYTGIIIFIVILFITFAIQAGMYFNEQSGSGMLNFIMDIMSSGSLVIIMLAPLLCVIFLLISVSNAVLLLREGRSVKNILGVILGIVFVAAAFSGSLFDALYYNLTDMFYDASISYITMFIQGFVSYIIVYFDCIFLAACICSLAASFRKAPYDRDYIIILGCGLKKDGTLLPLLRGRVDSAINFVKKQKESTGKNCIFVPSGGQGGDEIIAEGDAMKNYLVEQGIDEQNILVENKSKTTLENMMFSKKLIDERNPNAKVAFSTTRYHLFRSGMYASAAGLNAVGVGSKTRWYFWPNAFLREFVGVICAKVKYHIITAVILFFINLLLVGGGIILLLL